MMSCALLDAGTGGGGDQMHPEASQSPASVTAEASSIGFACGAHRYSSRSIRDPTCMLALGAPTRARPDTARPSAKRGRLLAVVGAWLLGDQLDEVAARVIEDGDDGRADGGWLGEHDALPGQPRVLGLDVVDGELRERDAVLDESVPVRLDGGVARRLEQELGAAGRLRRDDGEPGVVAERYVSVLGEPEDVGVEGEGCPLVVDVTRSSGWILMDRSFSVRPPPGDFGRGAGLK